MYKRQKQGWEVVAVYQDDGFTGLNMERPDLQRMLRAIERRQINLVITKDLSRLGRNYLQTGHLISLADAATYNEQFRKWKYDDLPKMCIRDRTWGARALQHLNPCF